MPEAYCMIITTCADRASARMIARDLVEQKLAACVQLSDIESFYSWQGRVENDPEVRLVIKTRNALYKAVEERILDLHGYDVPQIICTPVTDGFDVYLEWVSAETGE